MPIQATNNTVKDQICASIRAACYQFIEYNKYLEDKVYDNVRCLRDIFHEKLVSNLPSSVWVWGRTEYLKQKEISFQDICCEKNNSSHLPRGFGGVDIVVSDKEKSPRNGKGLYAFLDKRVLLSDIICCEVKVLHYNKTFTACTEQFHCDESSYFLYGKHKCPDIPACHKSVDINKFKFYRDGDHKKPTTCGAGQLLSDIARGAFILNHQANAIENFYLVGAIIGNNKYKPNIRFIENQIILLYNEIVEKQVLLYADQDVQYIPNLKKFLSNVSLAIYIHPFINKKDCDVFMFPYTIVISRNDYK